MRIRTSSVAATAFAAAAALFAGAMTAPQAAQAAAPVPQVRHGAVTATCGLKDLSFKVQNVSRPINHALLVATNTGSAPCNAVRAPFVGFDDSQYVLGSLEASAPQAVVTLQPGQSAYAGIKTSTADDSANWGYFAKTARISLDTGDGSGGSTSTVTVRLPQKTWIDDTAWVTYWQTDAESALSW
ncbi:MULTISPECIES: DUF4232 domain-containing protein [Streptomyces]|uniref:DUF4232 domain-containing protein n=1 Tax=Streptomyces luteosporeus TaxID=173856 RepID=A0ABN3U5Q6_9ACTN